MAQSPCGVYVTPQTQSFGVRQTTEPITAEFEIKNLTDQTVTMERVQLSCGCTKLDLPESTIPPGEAVAAKMRVNPSGQSGIRRFSAWLTTNSKHAPNLELVLEGNIIVEECGEELSYDIGKFAPNQPINSIAWISKRGYPDAAFQDIRHVDGLLRGEPGPPSEHPDKVLGLRVTGIAPSKEGTFDTQFQVELKDASWSSSAVRIRGTVSRKWRGPQTLYLGFIERDQTVTKEALFKNVFAGVDERQVKSARVAIKAQFSATSSVTPDGNISLIFSAIGEDFTGPLESKAVGTIQLSDGTQEEVELQVFARSLKEE